MIIGPKKRLLECRLIPFCRVNAGNAGMWCNELYKMGWMLQKVYLTLTGIAASRLRIRAEEFQGNLHLMDGNEYLFCGTLGWLERTEACRSEVYARDVERRRRKAVRPGQDLTGRWYVTLCDPEIIGSGYYLNGHHMIRVDFPIVPFDLLEIETARWTVELLIGRVLHVPLSEEELNYECSGTAKRLHLQDQGAAGVPGGEGEGECLQGRGDSGPED